MRWDELQNMVDQYQTGVSPNTDEPIRLMSDEEKRHQEVLEDLQMRSTYQGRKAMRDMRGSTEASLERNVSEEMHDLGYGDFRKDYNLDFGTWKKDPTDYRANSQSSAGKFFNGMAKIIPYAATTYLDNTVGLVAGIANMAADATDGQDGFHPLNSFINNPFSELMQNVRDWSERFLPNYRTTEETDDSSRWWRHLNANFWGDVFLKNLGFTIGAAFSGLTYTKGFELLQKGAIKNAYRAGLAASMGDQNAISGFRKLLQGGFAKNPTAIYNAAKGMADSYAKLGWKANLIGGIGGAIGESRVEAINSADEHMKAVVAAANEDYEAKKQRLMEYLLSNTDFSDGVNLNPEGRAYYENRIREYQKEYADSMNVAEKESRALANTVFMLNMPLLTASNIIMFGKMYSGGYNSQAQKLLRGTFGNLSSAVSKSELVTTPLKNAVSEGVEELSQKIISEGAKDIASKNMAYFHDKQYDKNALRFSSEWLMSMLRSAGDVLIDPSSWEEFAVGALTGALGMPSSNGWSGGVIGGIQEAKERINKSNELAKELNDRINNSDFKQLWLGLGRVAAIEDEKAKELQKGNQYSWKTLQDEQRLATVMLADRAGMLDEFEEYVKSFGNINASNIGEFLETLGEDKAEFEKMDSETLVAEIRDRANKAATAIRQYRDYYNAIDFMSLGTTSKSAIEELIFTEAQIKNFEKRYNDVLNEVWAEVGPTLIDKSKEANDDGTPTEDAKKAQRLLEHYDRIGNIFGGVAFDYTGRGQDASPSAMATKFKEVDDKYQADVLKDLKDLGMFTNKEALEKKVTDLQKLIRSRQDFYAKLFDPTNRESFKDRHEREAKQADSVANSIKKDATENKAKLYYSRVSEAKNFNEYNNIMASLDELGDEERDAFYKLINDDDRLKAYSERASQGYSLIGNVKEAAEGYLKNIPEADTEMRAPYQAIADVATKMSDSFAKEMADISDNDDIVYFAANKLLSKFAEGSTGYNRALAIMRNLINDKDITDRLGVVPKPQPATVEGAGEPVQGPEIKPGPEVNPVEEVKGTILKVTDINDSTLNQIANGDFTGYDNLSDEDRTELSAIAQSRLADLKEDAGQLGTNEDAAVNDSELNNVETKRTIPQKQLLARISKTIRGYALDVYDTALAKRGIRKRKESANPYARATYEFMRKHKVQEFIDSGALNHLLEKYGEKELPIYFLGNPHYLKNNQAHNPFATEKGSNLLLAIEMNEENRGILANYDGKVFDDSTLLEVDGVKYLIIGEYLNPNPNSDWFKKELNGEERTAFNESKKLANFAWEYAMRGSINRQYALDKDGLGEDGRWYVAKLHQENQNDKAVTDVDTTKGDRIYTTINYILPGRVESSAGLEEPTIGSAFKRDLGKAMSEYKSYGGEYHFALQTQLGTTYSPGAPTLPVGINPSLGSVWIATKAANGSWEWSYLRVAKTSEVNPSAWESGDGVFSSIRKDINTILAPIDRSVSEAEFTLKLKEKNDARKRITDKIYFGKGNYIIYDWDADGNIVMSIAGQACTNQEQAINALRTGNYRFQVGREAVTDMRTMNQLMDSGVLLTDRMSFIPIAASFGINPLTNKDAEGNTIPLTHVKSSEAERRFNPISERDSNPESVSATSINDIVVDNTSYNFDYSTGIVSRRGVGGSLVQEERPDVIAQVKVISELLHPDTAPVKYPGSNRVINTPGQYTELYERIVGDIKVQIVRRGANGNFEVCLNQDTWNGLVMKSELVGGEELKASVETKESAPVIPEQLEGQEQSGAVVKKEPPKPGDVNAAKGHRERKKKTATEYQIDITDVINEVDCP